MRLNKMMLCILAVACACLLPMLAQAQKAAVGIPDYRATNYVRATQVLKAQLPEFFTKFETLEYTLGTLQYDDKAAQYQALMDFFPTIEKVLSVEPDIKMDVVTTYFAIRLDTASDTTTTIQELIFDAFQAYVANGDATRILSEKELMKKHNIDQQTAQHIREVLHKLYPTSEME